MDRRQFSQLAGLTILSPTFFTKINEWTPLNRSFPMRNQMIEYKVNYYGKKGETFINAIGTVKENKEGKDVHGRDQFYIQALVARVEDDIYVEEKYKHEQLVKDYLTLIKRPKDKIIVSTDLKAYMNVISKTEYWRALG